MLTRCSHLSFFFFFFFNDTATTEIYTLSLHDALPICFRSASAPKKQNHFRRRDSLSGAWRSEEHTSELQSRLHLVCRLLLEKKKLSSYLCRSSTPYSSCCNSVFCRPVARRLYHFCASA